MRRIEIPSRGLSFDLSGLSADSRKIRPGFLFAALPGTKADGRAFIPAALEAGAAVVLGPPDTVLPPGSVARLVTDPAPERVFAHIAAAFYGSQPEKIVAVTGTNGKTSTVFFCWQLWDAAGEKAAALGTLGVSGNVLTREGTMTTPDTASLHETLAELSQAGVERLAMEASSHGLAQHRMESVDLCAAGFTNLTRDHIDYHGTMEAYFAAKSRLFSECLPSGGTAVLNADLDVFESLKSLCHARGHRVFSYGRQGKDLVLHDVAASPDGIRLGAEIMGRKFDGMIPVAGLFQAENILCATGLALAADPDGLDVFLDRLCALRAPPGRAQRAGTLPGGASIYVDYAHTPDGLDNILASLRVHTTGRLVCVFGCGGDRDSGKRALMGAAAARGADLCIVTDDNPRTEDPARIRAAILSTAPGALEIPDRREAIRHAVSILEPGDVLVVAGKGHERGQILGARVEPFDDTEEVLAAIDLVAQSPAKPFQPVSRRLS
ncbi:MAG TPA: UDP-N-acetylmuramoyl-L-alanyl-D-glutamate--2,6-diaminopimelate ligase [Alphaproteobacteria bacterium]|nr:UDP-N-acetylmuramoyl-L-alanyl-D-glutamate--2,6-diaminopimelate ligase [Alphaproteobacteria bacterium]